MEHVNKSAQNARKRKEYAEMPHEKKQKRLQQMRELRALKKRSLVLNSSNSSDPNSDNLNGDKCERNAKRRKTYAAMPLEKKERVLLRRREKTALNRASKAVVNIGSLTKREMKNIGLSDFVPNCANELPFIPDCIHCKAKRFKGESDFFCCGGGEIYFEAIPMHEGLRSLLVGKTPQSIHFRSNIRTYNNNLAFTSLGARYDQNMTSNHDGVYTFKVHGQVHHYLNPLNKVEGRKLSGVQLYFFDTDQQELENRMKVWDKFEERTMKLLMEILRDNPYRTFFKMLSTMGDLETKNIVLNADPKFDQRKFDQRTYNLPTVSQVAAIYTESVEQDGDSTIPIRVYGKKDESYSIKHYYGCYDPMQYPLMFPGGHPGWHRNIKRYRKRHLVRNDNGQTLLQFDSPESLINAESKVVRDGKRNKHAVTAREYYCYKLQMRDDDLSMFLHMGRLLQQFVVDTYVKIETARLEHHRERQSEFRTEMAQGVIDGIDVGLKTGDTVGIPVYLSSSFTGSPRDMRKRYLDAMAIVQKYGKPDVFLTMTCNPRWPEIVDNLKYGVTANDRPDLCARVFKGKVEQLKEELVTKEVLGAVDSLIYAIEYQKRGLPHVHMLIILKPGSKPLGPDGYDRIVCAELPDPEKDPHLFDVVTKNMMHGPCGESNKKCACMIDGKCKFGFPKPFRQFTSQADDGFPLYRRRDDGRTVEIRNVNMGNDWVATYNPYLAAIFGCHINVEICNTLTSVKYIHKYIFKGCDRIGYAFQSGTKDKPIDEIKLFQDGRWIGPSEAAWRIFSFKLNYMNPSVYTLQVHLPDQQFITFRKDSDLETVVANELSRSTTLTGFFWMNTHNSDAKELNLLYKEFPEEFVWAENKRIWTKRKNKQVIGRLVAVSPTEGERYYLRLLLNRVRCPTSYEDLKTVQGINYPSYREAATALGFLSSDNYIEETLDEACGFQMPGTLRSLFAILFAFCDIQNPKELWQKYKSKLCSDFREKGEVLTQNQESLIERRALRIINDFLVEMNKDLRSFGLLDDIDLETYGSLATREVLCEKSIQVSKEELLLWEQLNNDQKRAYDEILENVYSETGKCFFIDGPGGTGKTFLYRSLLAKIRSEGHIALAVASSGVAASVLPGGRTAHSRFKISIDSTKKQVCTVSKQSGLARLIIEAKLILWDEATMAKREYLEAVDNLLRDLMDSEAPFGGKVVLFGGDFRQTLPVTPEASREKTISSSIIYSKLWPELKKLKLEQNMRAISDPEFCSFLLRIGEGTEPIDDNEEVELPHDIIIPYIGKEESFAKLIECVFTDLNSYARNPIDMVGRCILAATNSCVDRINGFLIESFPGVGTEYISTDRTIDEKQQSDYEEFLHTLNPKGFPSHKLVLKPNCPIMLTRNLNPTEGLCNGTRLICIQLCQSTIRAEIAFGSFKGKKVFIPRIPLRYEEQKKHTIPFIRTQFPVRLCFAMTINKSQGQTLDFVGLYLERPVFSHGQLYVALSRAKTSKTVKVLLTPPTFEERRPNNKTKNVVFTEIFNDSLINRDTITEEDDDVDRSRSKDQQKLAS